VRAAAWCGVTGVRKYKASPALRVSREGKDFSEGEVTELLQHREVGGRKKRDWENCVTAFMLSELLPAIALQLCALAAVGWLVSGASLRERARTAFHWEAQNKQCCRLLPP
jgi:hypothetical protein